jgi:hypothetical protein
VAPTLAGFGPLLDVPGVFVFGSNDYYAPTPRNPAWYLLPDDGRRNTHSTEASVRGPARGVHRPWLAGPEQRRRPARGARVAAGVRGVDDPHLRLDDLSAVAGPRRPTRTFASASRTRRTSGCWTSSRATGTT